MYKFNKLKLAVMFVSGLIPLTFDLTFFLFLYRYMWFSVEAVPMERMFVAVIGGVVTTIVWGVSMEYFEPLAQKWVSK